MFVFLLILRIPAKKRKLPGGFLREAIGAFGTPELFCSFFQPGSACAENIRRLGPADAIYHAGFRFVNGHHPACGCVI